MLTPLLLCLVAPSNGTFAQSAKEVEVNGVRLHYVEQGSGEPIVFVHGGLGDAAILGAGQRRSPRSIGSSR